MYDKLIEYLETRKQTVTKLMEDAKTDKDREKCEIAIKLFDSIIQDVRNGKIN